MLAQGVSFRTNLNSDSTKLAGVDSSHTSNASTMQFCKLPISLQIIPKTNELAKCNPNKEIKLIKRLINVYSLALINSDDELWQNGSRCDVLVFLLILWCGILRESTIHTFDQLVLLGFEAIWSFFGNEQCDLIAVLVANKVQEILEYFYESLLAILFFWPQTWLNCLGEVGQTVQCCRSPTAISAKMNVNKFHV